MASFRVNCALVVTVVLWASAFSGIRFALTTYSPGSLALLRFLIASICLALIYSQIKHKTPLPWFHRLQLLSLGMAGIGLYNIFLNYGEIIVSAGVASFIIGLMPVITVIISIIFLKEQQKKAIWLGIAISFLGLLLIALSEKNHGSLTRGVFMVLVSAFLGAFYSLMSRYYLRRYSPIVVTSWVMWGGTLILMIFLPELLHEWPLANSKTTTAVIYMGVFPAALAYISWNYALHHLSAAKASMYLYAIPMTSILIGFFFLHEVPSLLSLTGGAIALLGAFITNQFFHSVTPAKP